MNLSITGKNNCPLSVPTLGKYGDMAGRLPDLLWEIEHGKKTDPKLMKKNALYYISVFLPWVAFPVLYYSLYKV